MLYYFKKDKNATETHTKISAVYGEGAETDPTGQKQFAKFRAGDFLLEDGPWSGRPVGVDSDQIEMLKCKHSVLGRMGDSQHTQNIPINQVIGENEKCVFNFTAKPIHTFWPTQYLEGRKKT